MGKFKFNPYRLLTILNLSLLIAVISILKVIVGAFSTPKNYAYLAVGHYWSDYFEYVQQVMQGMRGHWLVNNPFTANDPTRTFLGWEPYLLIGKFGSLFHWSPYFTYWFTVFFLTLIVCLLTYKLVTLLLPKESFLAQLGAWLLGLLATQFVNTRLVPYDYWYFPLSLFHRLGSAPHHLLSTIFIILIIILLAKLFSDFHKFNLTKITCLTLSILFIMISLLSFAPFYVISIMSGTLTLGFIDLIKKVELKLVYFLGLLVGIILPTALFFKYLHTGPLFQSTIAWETAQQSYPSLWELILYTGPVLIFIPFGIKSYFQEKTPLKILFFLFTLFSYLYFYTPLSLYLGSHNHRFLSPVSYTLFGVLAFLGMKAVTNRLPKNKIFPAGTVIIFLGYFVVITAILYQTTFSTVDQLSYLPKDLITGIKTLDSFPDKKAVLTSPALSLGVIVPVIADRNVYLGRLIFTPDFAKRTALSDQFYLGQLSDQQARNLMQENNIGYVILGAIEKSHSSYNSRDLEKYSFLKKIFENNQVAIYKVI